jgi:hypothetical protein
MAAHVVATTLACYFSFFLILSLEAVLLLVLSPRLFRTVSLVVRSVLAIGCVAFLTAFAVGPNVLSRVFEGMAELRQSRPSAALAVPPLWFAAIYEKLIGRGNPFYDAAAWRGIAAVLGLAGFVFFALSWSFRKHMRKSLEVRTRRRSFQRGRERIQDVFDGLFLRHPVQRAIFHYFGKTIRNSPRQKNRLAGSLAVAVGLLIVLLIRLQGFPRTAGAADSNVLAIPLILAIALLLSLRTGVNIPLSAEANWVFRLTESPIRRHYFSALKKAVFVFALLPLSLVLFGGHMVLWGPGQAALHILYGLSCALVFCEVFFWRYAKVPFSCLVVPGKTQVQKYWLLYLLAFILTVSLFSALERTLIRTPSSFPVFFGLAGALLAGMIIYQRFAIYEKLQIVYEEEPEPVMVTL